MGEAGRGGGGGAPSCGGDPHGFPYPLPSAVRSPNPRGTHGQNRLGLCPCPPGSPAGRSLGDPLQAEKGDVSHQPCRGPKRRTRGACYRQPSTTSVYHSHNLTGSGRRISLHCWGTEAPRGPEVLPQAHREQTRPPGSWGRAEALESGDPGFGTQSLCDLEPLSLTFLTRNTDMMMSTLQSRCED